jgi:hypothetical protein
MKTEKANLTGNAELTAGRSAGRGSKWLGGISSVFASVLAFKCPACIPALAAFLSAVGLSIGNAVFVKWVTVAFLAIGVISLAWSARLHRRWWILAAAVFGAAMIYGGRYLWFSQPLLWAGTAILIGSAAANLFAKRRCPHCAQCANETQQTIGG